MGMNPIVFTVLKSEKELEMARQASTMDGRASARLEQRLRRASPGRFSFGTSHQDSSERQHLRCLEQNTRCDLGL
jgi:Xaa-Pro aminopeptidase